MNKVIGFGLGLAVLLSSVFVVLFLGGLASAAIEVRRERAAGLEPTRPAWENREKRRVVGGFVAQVRGAWEGARHRGVRQCWCLRGPLVEFGALDGGSPAGIGCAAWEAGDSVAVLRHDAAGGYARLPLRAAS